MHLLHRMVKMLGCALHLTRMEGRLPDRPALPYPTLAHVVRRRFTNKMRFLL